MSPSSSPSPSSLPVLPLNPCLYSSSRLHHLHDRLHQQGRCRRCCNHYLHLYYHWRRRRCHRLRLFSCCCQLLLLSDFTPFQHPHQSTFFQRPGKKCCVMNTIRICMTSHIATVLSITLKKMFTLLINMTCTVEPLYCICMNGYYLIDDCLNDEHIALHVCGWMYRSKWYVYALKGLCHQFGIS